MGGRGYTHSHMGKEGGEEEEEEEEEGSQFRFGVWVDTEATVKVSPVTRSVSPRRRRRRGVKIYQAKKPVFSQKVIFGFF